VSLASQLSAAACELADASRADTFQPVRERLASLGVDDRMLGEILQRVSHGPGDQREVLQLRARVQGTDQGGPPASFERYALLRTALAALERVPALLVPDRVKELLLDEFLWLTRPRERELGWLVAGEYVFSALCKLATLRRFPAGQFHWEMAGLARSVLWRVPTRHLPRLLRGVLALGGFRPTFAPHLAWRRPQIVLSEREHSRSLLLMAQTLELQPRIRGFVAEAWFYSPDIIRVSPHLAWAPRLFEEWGGMVIVTGPAGKESGIFERGRTRERLARQGLLQPTMGLALWPRSAMLRWARLNSAEAG